MQLKKLKTPTDRKLPKLITANKLRVSDTLHNLPSRWLTEA